MCQAHRRSRLLQDSGLAASDCRRAYALTQPAQSNTPRPAAVESTATAVVERSAPRSLVRWWIQALAIAVVLACTLSWSMAVLR